jgi:hypothetical protein
MLNVLKKMRFAVFLRPRLARAVLIQAQQVAQNFEPSRGSSRLPAAASPGRYIRHFYFCLTFAVTS